MIIVMSYIVYHNTHVVYLTFSGAMMNIAIYALIDMHRDFVRIVRGKYEP